VLKIPPRASKQRKRSFHAEEWPLRTSRSHRAVRVRARS
jgi:hypothetical protein